VKIALANNLLLLTFLLWCVALWRRQARWPRGSIIVAGWFYVAASVAAVVFSQEPATSVMELGELATLLVIPMTVSLLDRAGWERLLRLLALTLGASSAVGLWQYAHGASSLAHRLKGLTTHYMTFSGWTLVVLLLLVGDMAFNRDRRRLLWTLPVAGLATVALLLSYSRNAWVGLAAGLVLAAAVWKPRLILVYPVVALALLAVLPRPVVERAVSIVDLRQPANYDRLCMVTSAVGMIQDHPVFGVGLGMVERRYPLYRRDDAPRWHVPHLHNNVLQVTAERGLFGLAAYLGMLLTFFVTTWRLLHDRNHPAFPALAGCFLAVAGVTVAGFFEYNWGDAEVWIVTLTCLAVPFALGSEAS